MVRLKRSYPLQLAIVSISSIAGVLITDAAGFRSPVNTFWMLGIPVAVGFGCNCDWDRRALMSMVLMGTGLTTAMVVGVAFTSYG